MKTASTRRFCIGDLVYITNGGIRERRGRIVSKRRAPAGYIFTSSERLVELEGAPRFLYIADINPSTDRSHGSIERVDPREAGYPYPPSVHFPKKPATGPNGGQ